jgi:hypothetical protein
VDIQPAFIANFSVRRLRRGRAYLRVHGKHGGNFRAGKPTLDDGLVFRRANLRGETILFKMRSNRHKLFSLRALLRLLFCLTIIRAQFQDYAFFV